MIADRLAVPKFASEAEEAEWWYDHRDEHGEITLGRWKKAAQSRQGSSRQARYEAHKIQVKLDCKDVDLARAGLGLRGIDAET